MRPKRIQRKRTKDWRMPENTIYVGRPSRWGNPFNWKVLVEPCITENEAKRYAHKHFERWIRTGEWSELDFMNDVITPLHLIERRLWILNHIHELRGRNYLACWCPLDQPCHADVLLELANQMNEK